MIRSRFAASVVAACLLIVLGATGASGVSVADGAVALGRCSIAMSNQHPRQLTSVTAKVRALDRAGHPIKGAKVRFAWYLKSGQVSETKSTDARGYAYSRRNVGRAPINYRVVVRGRISYRGVVKSVATWFVPVAATSSIQRVSVGIDSSGYVPSTVRVTAGKKIAFTIAKGTGCAAGLRIPSLGISVDNTRGPVTFSIPALKPGTYKFTCGMGMLTGYIVAK